MIGSAGNLYVTASVGEAYGDGVVFKLSETGERLHSVNAK